MDCFVSWDSDDLARDVKRAAIEDNVERIRQTYQTVDNASRIWHSWVESIGGSIISIDGDQGRAVIPADRLSEITGIHAQYAGAINSSVSVGVGRRVSQADKALLVAKKRGGGHIILYTPEIEHELAQGKDKKDPVEEIVQSHLGKSGPGLFEGNEHAGMSGASHPTPPAPPAHAAPEHSQGESMRALMSEENPGHPEMTHAAKDFEEYFHQLAEKQGQQDEAQKKAETESKDQTSGLKQQVAQVLEQVRSQAQTLEAIKSQAPQVYQAIMGMVKAVIAMARQLPGDQQQDQRQDGDQPEQQEVKKSEPQFDLAEQPLSKSLKSIRPGRPIDVGKLPAGLQLPVRSEMMQGMRLYDYSHTLTAALVDRGYQLIVVARSKGARSPGGHPIAAMVLNNNDHEYGPIVGRVTGSISKYQGKDGGEKPAVKVKYASVNHKHSGQKLGKLAYEALYAHAIHFHNAEKAVGDVHSTPASITHQKLAEEHGVSYKPEPNYGDNPYFADKEQWEKAPTGEFDNKYKGYAYTLKSEGLSKAGETPPDPDLARRIEEIANTTKASIWERVRYQDGLDAEYQKYAPRHWGGLGAVKPEDIQGAKCVVGPNAHVGANDGETEYLPFRVTYIGNDEMPTGHSEHSTYQEALNAAVYWGGVDLNSKPVGALKKHEEYFEDWYKPLIKAQKIELQPDEAPPKGNKLDKEEFDPEELEMGIKEEMEHTDDPKESEKTAKDHLKKDPKYYSKLKAAFAKGLPMPNPKPVTHHHVTLPVGSQKDHSAQATREVGKVKVAHGDGKQGWVEVRAGQVLSADGHAISSRNKGGK